MVQFSSFDGLGGVKSTWQDILDTSLCFFDMLDFQRRLRAEPIHPITEKLCRSGLVEAAGFPVVVQALELIAECINHYNPATEKILFSNQTVLILVDRKALVNFLRIPEHEEFSTLTIRGAM